MSCILSNKVLSPQNYLEKMTGDCFIINTCDDFKQIEKILYEKGIRNKIYTLSELEMAVSTNDCLAFVEGLVPYGDECFNELRIIATPYESCFASYI